MSLKAKLSVILKADDVVVAETTDLKLWLQILTTLSEASVQAPHNAEHHAGEHGHSSEHPGSVAA
jgi:hypothetical protein